MIKTLKYTSKKLFSPILIIILGLTIHFGLSFFLEKKEVLNDVDHQLIIAAGNIRYYLGNDYIKKDIDGTTYAADEAMKKSIFLDRLAKEIGVDFLYLIVKKEDGIYYAITSESLESINESEEPSYYWYSLKDSKDDSYELTRKSFDKKKPTFLNSTDIWGSYRSVYLPQVSDDGTVYLAGADFTTSSLRNKIISRVTLDMLNSVLLLILALPFIFSFQKLLNEREIITKKIHDLDSLDSLTGAYNRNTGLEILKKIIESSKYKGSPLSICLVDIQNLGYINKNMGFSAGDNIIRIVYNILSKNFRQTDKIIRFEGDKFIVILPGCTK